MSGELWRKSVMAHAGSAAVSMCIACIWHTRMRPSVDLFGVKSERDAPALSETPGQHALDSFVQQKGVWDDAEC